MRITYNVAVGTGLYTGTVLQFSQGITETISGSTGSPLIINITFQNDLIFYLFKGENWVEPNF